MTWEDKIYFERKDAKEEGRLEGEWKKLIELVCKKLRRGKSPEQIAEELEEEEAVIAKICELAALDAPEYDGDAVFERWQEKMEEE
ncbi:MAG: hypothetical protein IJY09_01170 [Lachnospiraceae bacterium]|nr:hypothetical protein [Lachnospiraceae bacterium]